MNMPPHQALFQVQLFCNGDRNFRRWDSPCATLGQSLHFRQFLSVNSASPEDIATHGAAYLHISDTCLFPRSE